MAPHTQQIGSILFQMVRIGKHSNMVIAMACASDDAFRERQFLTCPHDPQTRKCMHFGPSWWKWQVRWDVHKSIPNLCRCHPWGELQRWRTWFLFLKVNENKMRKNACWNVLKILTGCVFSFTVHRSPVKHSGVSLRPVARCSSGRVNCNDVIYFHSCIR